MILRPAQSTLFPYTTLFRSQKYEDGEGVEQNYELAAECYRKAAGARSGPEPMHEAKQMTTGQPVGAASQDRKSTRLNSSHTVISYAVFCLKKKIRKNENSKE